MITASSNASKNLDLVQANASNSNSRFFYLNDNRDSYFYKDSWQFKSTQQRAYQTIVKEQNNFDEAYNKSAESYHVKDQSISQSNSAKTLNDVYRENVEDLKYSNFE